MPLSSFQVEWLLHRIRQRRGAVNKKAREKYEKDQVSLSAGGMEKVATDSHGRESRADALLQNTWPVDLQERVVRPPVVDYEMERRAGSFMRPKFPPWPPPATIPRLMPWRNEGPAFWEEEN